MTDEMFEAFGPRVTRSRFEREFYARDLAYVPEPLLKVLVRPLPDVVVRPVTSDEVAEILRYANEKGIPVTTRAGGSTAYGNVVPARAGILLDMNSFREVGEVDEDRMTVWVAPGVTWLDLDRDLSRCGFAVCSYPSSARVATVGGWFSMGGLGIGSLKYGPLEQLVESAEVVLAGGEVKRLTRDSSPPSSWFAGSEGTLGVITGIELNVRPRPEQEDHHLIECPDVGTAVKLADELIRGLGSSVFNAHINSAAYNRLMAELDYTGHPTDRLTLSIDVEGSGAEVDGAKREIDRCAERHGGSLCDREIATEEWDSRFSSLRIKRQLPSLLGAELLLPLDRFEQYLDGCGKLAADQKTEISSYGHIVDPEHILVMSLLPTDERRVVRYVMDTSLLSKLYRIGAELGGAPYAIGLWNTAYVKKAFDKDVLRERTRRKALLDPKGIMNPGKSYSPPALLHPALFGPGMASLAWIRKRSTGRGGA